MYRSLRQIQKALAVFRNLPLHPQWLLGKDKVPDFLLSHARGLVLDIGCADRWLDKVLPETCQYIGLDYPLTGDVLYGARPDVFSDAARLPFQDESFDTVVLFEVLEHLSHPQQAMQEIARVLKPGGCLLLSIPFMYPMHDEPHDYQRYTRHGLIREVKKAGLHLRHLSSVLSSIESGGLLMSLAFAGTAKVALEKKSPGLVLIPVLVLLILLVNCVAWILARLLPDWPAMTNNFQLVAEKKSVDRKQQGK